jgi:hypothetical protein
MDSSSSSSSSSSSYSSEIHYNLCKKVAVLTKSIVHLNMKLEDEEGRRQAERDAHAQALNQIEAASIAKLEALVHQLDPKGTVQRYEKVLSDLTERYDEEKKQAARDLLAHSEAYANARMKNEAAYVKRLSELEAEVAAAKEVLDAKTLLLEEDKTRIESEAKSAVEVSNKMLEETRAKHLIDLQLEKDKFETRITEMKEESERRLIELKKEKESERLALQNEMRREKLEALSLLQIENNNTKEAAEEREKELINELENERSKKSEIENVLKEKTDLLENTALDLKKSQEEVKIVSQERDKASKRAVEASTRKSVVEDEMKRVQEQLRNCSTSLTEEEATVKKLTLRAMEAEELLKSLQSSGSEDKKELELLRKTLEDSLKNVSTLEEVNTQLKNDRRKADEEVHSLQEKAEKAEKEAQDRENKLNETLSALEERHCRENVERDSIIEALQSDITRLKYEIETSLQETIRAKSEAEARIQDTILSGTERLQSELSALSLSLTTMHSEEMTKLESDLKSKHNEEMTKLESEWIRKLGNNEFKFEAETVRTTQVWQDRVSKLEQDLLFAKSQLDSTSSSRLIEEEGLRSRITLLESTLSSNETKQREDKQNYDVSLRTVNFKLQQKEEDYELLQRKADEEKALLLLNIEKERNDILSKHKEEINDWMNKVSSLEANLSSTSLQLERVRDVCVAEGNKRVLECELLWKAKLDAAASTILQLENLLNEKESLSSTDLSRIRQEFATALLAAEARVDALTTEVSVVKMESEKALKDAAIASEHRISEVKTLMLLESSRSIDELISQNAKEMANAVASADMAREAEIAALKSSLQLEFKALLLKIESELEEEAKRLIESEKESHLLHLKKSLDELRNSLELDYTRAIREAESLNRSRELSSLDALRSTLLFERSQAEGKFQKEIAEAKEVAIMAAETAAKQISDVEKEMERLRLDAIAARRESRPEDIDRIERLVQLVKQKEEEAKFFKLELLNRETNFNKLFSGGGSGGIGGGGGGLVVSSTDNKGVGGIDSGGGGGGGGGVLPLAVGSGPRAVTALSQRMGNSTSDSYPSSSSSTNLTSRRSVSKTTISSTNSASGSSSYKSNGPFSSSGATRSSSSSSTIDVNGEPSMPPPPLPLQSPVGLSFGPGGQPPSPTTISASSRTNGLNPPAAPYEHQPLKQQQHFQQRKR